MSSIAILMGVLATGQTEPTLEPPQLIEESRPDYPEQAAGVSAAVVLELDVDTDGRVETATVAHVELSSDAAPELAPLFASASLQAAQALRFSPARVEGKPVPVRLAYTFRFVAPVPEPVEEPALSLTGLVREAGTRRAIAGALVIVRSEDRAFEVLTDDAGRFAFYDLQDEWQLTIDSAGYHPFETEIHIASDESHEVIYTLRPKTQNPYDVIVEGRSARETTRRRIASKEASKVAGTLGDAFLALDNLPGVARAGPVGAPPIRGSAPGDSRSYIEGLGVNYTTHVGGFRSALPSAMVEQVDFLPGNFSVRYGRGTGGVVNVALRSIDPDQIHGSVDVSLLDVGLYLEGPLGDDVALAVAGRRSYLDAVLEAVAPAGDDTQLTTAPEWYDYQLLLEARPSPHHRFRLFGIGAFDALELRTGNAAEQSLEATTNAVGSRSQYQRLYLQHRYAQGRFTNDLRVGVGRDQGRNLAFGLIDFEFELLELTLREEARLQASKSFALIMGLDGFARRTNADVTTIRPPKEGDPPGAGDLDGELLSAEDTIDELQMAAYLEAEWTIGERLTVVPGVRIDYFGLIDALTFDPRVQLRYRVASNFELSAGVGLVHQQPFIDELVEPFGNPELGPERAVHASFGARYQPFQDLVGDLTFFYKDLSELARRVDDGRNFANDGSGRVYGLEVYIRKKLASNLSGWLSYTLSRAERTDRSDGRVRLFDYDQTHILSLVARYELPRDWGVGLRWRFNSGAPYTPALPGTFIEARDAYEPGAGPPNSARLGAFHALDVRIDKKWYFDAWALTAFVSVSNAYNRANPEAIAYSYDYRQEEETTGLPILPILGLEGSF